MFSCSLAHRSPKRAASFTGYCSVTRNKIWDAPFKLHSGTESLLCCMHCESQAWQDERRHRQHGWPHIHAHKNWSITLSLLLPGPKISYCHFRMADYDIPLSPVISSFSKCPMNNRAVKCHRGACRCGTSVLRLTLTQGHMHQARDSSTSWGDIDVPWILIRHSLFCDIWDFQGGDYKECRLLMLMCNLYQTTVARSRYDYLNPRITRWLCQYTAWLL
jgi:hypothetical protein